VQIALNIFLALLILTAIVSFVLRRTFLSVKPILWIFLFLCILSSVVQHYVFGTMYLLDRAALFFYPLFIFCLCFSVNDFEEKWYAKGILLIVIAFGVNFFCRANLYKTANWFYDAHTEEILSRFNQQGIDESRMISIDFSWPFERSAGYYYKRNHYENLQIVKNQDNKDAYNVKADYYIFLDHSLEKVNYEASQQKVLQYTKKYVSSYPREHIVIYSNIIHDGK
jgi:hypothetical protein